MSIMTKARTRIAVASTLLGIILLGSATWAQNFATLPTPRAEISWWMPRFYENVRQAEAGDVDLVFIGDSITHGWERAGADTWNTYYAHRKAVNFGFSGDRTQHVLWRLINGRIDRMRPKVAVLMIGTNNASSDTPNQVALGVRAICYTLRALLPDTKILLLGVFPRGEDSDNWLRGTNTVTNTLIAQLDDGDRIFYLDIGDDFLEADGTLSESVMPDRLHPNARGYEIWAEAMEPTLARLLGDQEVR
jgi:beta-glucosidase